MQLSLLRDPISCSSDTLQSLDLAQIEAIVADIEREKEAGKTLSLAHCVNNSKNLTLSIEAERKRSRLAATAAGQAAMSQAAGGSGQ